MTTFFEIDQAALAKQELRLLENEVSVGSIFLHDYKNSFGVTKESCFNFFDGYLSFLEDIMKEDGYSDSQFWDLFPKYDTSDNLLNWYYCYENDPFEYEEEDE